MNTYTAIITDATTAEAITNLVLNADDHMDAARIVRNLVADAFRDYPPVMVEVALKQERPVFLGDDQAPLCSEGCADCWANNNADGDHDGDGYFQTHGFIQSVDRIEVVGHSCAHCGKEIA